jgi:cell division septation protein DedD
MTNNQENEFWDKLEDASKDSKSFKFTPKIALIIILCCFIAGGGFYYYQEKNKSAKKTPFIKAEPGNFKTKPAYPGGMEVPNMDKTIYDNVSGKDAKPVKEKVLPSPEKPLNRDKALGIVAAKENKTTKAAPTSSIPLAAKPEKNIKGYILQLSSFKSQKKALEEWEKLKKKHTKLVTQYPKYFEKKNIAYSKQFYRLQMGPIPSESEARFICKKLKQEGQDCMVIKPS